MADNSMIIAGVLVAGAILLHGYSGNAERYQLSAAGADGRTVWRIDTRKGTISMCGSVLDGASFSKVQAQHTAAILNMAQNPSQDAQEKVIQEGQNIGTLSEPRCTEWSNEQG
jgi:hypothetical protein